MVANRKFYFSIIAITALAAMLCMGLIPMAYSAQVKTLNVEAGYIQTFTLNLADGAKFDGSLSIAGGSGDDINFWVTDPSGNQIISKRRVQSGGDFNFEANRDGAYTLHFDNSFSTFSDKQVRLTYDIQNPIIPQITGSGSGSGGGGCLIATAAFGSELTPQVQFLRNFRDNHILATASGTSFMTAFNTWYYSFSPGVADFERQQPLLQQTVKAAIYPLLGILQIAEKAYMVVPGEYGSITAGMVASSLIGAVYASPIAFSIKRIRKIKLDYRMVIMIIGVLSASVVGSLAANNNVALMTTTSLLVLSMIAICAIISANLLSKTINKIKEFKNRS